MQTKQQQIDRLRQELAQSAALLASESRTRAKADELAARLEAARDHYRQEAERMQRERDLVWRDAFDLLARHACEASRG